MPRFSLSSAFLDDNEDYDDTDNDNVVEPPHPIGFSPGSSRYAFDDKDYDSDTDNDDDNAFQEQTNFSPIITSSAAHVNTMTSPMKALARHVLENNSQQRKRQMMAAAARRDDYNIEQQENENDMNTRIDTLTRALRDGTLFLGSSASSLSSPSSAQSLMAITTASTIARSQLIPTAYSNIAQQEARIHQDMISTRQRFEREHEESARTMQALLDRNQQRAEQKEARLKQQQEELEHQQALEQQAQEDRLEAQRLKEQRQQEALEQQAEQKKRAQQARDEAKMAAEKKAAAATEYISRAVKLMAQLKQLRASVEPFETCKSPHLSKRRLAMKKIVNGRVNTLSEDVHKIRDVARDVSAAIDTSRQEDAQYKTQIDIAAAAAAAAAATAAGGGGQPSEFTAEMARGKRYFLDLLSSKVVVRVQAEGFNGQRGDGFPLAAMLAAIAVDNKDLVPVLTAHIFTVCPTAIPKLPTPSADATEEELMESLGMIKGKNGEFETFERFLSRTEGLISIVADIMSSEPPAHTLFGGHEGAVKWLARFLSQLPAAPQSPLPLLTAPVLDAFLTGAGHMLANKHSDEFKKYLDFIIGDCLPRIDEGTIGKPSATRLRKTIEGNFDGFKNKLPGRALAELYYGANSTGSASHGGALGGGVSQLSTFGSSAPASAPPRNPFGAPPSSSSNAAPNPFTAGSTATANTTTTAASSFTNTTTMALSPFTNTTTTAPSPFGQQQPQQTTFGGGGFGGGGGAFGSAPAPSQGLLGSAAPAPVVSTGFGFVSSAPATSLYFGSTGASTGGGMGLFGQQQPAQQQPQQQQSLFGAPAPAPSSFGSSAFGGAATMQNTTFGAAPATSSAFGTQSTLFGSAPATTAAPGMGPFGAPAPAPAPTAPFGSQTQTPFGQAPFGQGSNFGAATPVAAASVFGGAPAAAQPFGSATFGSGTGQYGGGSGSSNINTKAPCRFFAQGSCKYGSNCRFSHDTAFAGGGPGGGAFNSAPSPFAGGGPGGGAFNTAPSPFSNFGGPRR